MEDTYYNRGDKMTTPLFNDEELAELATLQENDAEVFAEDERWFERLKVRYLPRWEKRIKTILAEEQAAYDAAQAEQLDPLEMPVRRSRPVIEKEVADFAEHQLKSIDEEITKMLSRTTAVIAVTTLVFAAYTIRISPILATSLVLLAGLGMATFSFMRVVGAMAPPYERSKKPYADSYSWNLLVHNPFTRYVMYSMLRNRRTPVIQKYKRAHAVAIRVLQVAIALAPVAIALNIILELLKVK